LSFLVLKFEFKIKKIFTLRLMKKIVITGPESSGKTTIARRLAIGFKVPMVLEYARTYIDQLNRPYEQADLWEIAQGQLLTEKKVAADHPNYLICDTDLWTILIWSEEKYGTVDPRIIKLISQQKTDLYFLLKPTLPWEYDPQRENPSDRDRLFQIYRNKLQKNQQPFLEIDPTDDNYYTKIKIGLLQI